jgi:tetratricopeptide (TPR) repeat protein
MNVDLANAINRRGPFAVVMMAVLISVQGCSSSTDVAARKAVEAAALLDQGLAPAARIAAKKAVAARDDVADYWRLLGRAEMQNGNFAGAYDAYSHAIELDAADPESLQMLADIALRAGKLREAVKASDQLLSLQPTLTRPKLIKGMAALIEGRDKAAEELADDILASDPSEEVGKVLKARVLGRRQDFAGAIAILDNAATARTELTLTTLAELYRAAGDGPKLAAALRELNALSPNPGRIFDLASVEYKLGKRDIAREALISALRAKPDDLALHNRAFEFIAEYDPTLFDAAPDGVSDKAGIQMRVLVARVLLERGRPRQAVAVLERLIGAGTLPDVWALYLTATSALGKSGTSQMLARIIKSDETNGYALLLRSKLELGTGEFAGALRDAQGAVSDDPDNVQARLAVIAVYRARGDRIRPRQLFEDLLQKSPDSTVALRAYIAYLLEVKDPARALGVAQDFTFLNPARIDGWRIRQQLCVNSDCVRDSAAGLQRAATNFAPPEVTDVKRAGVMGRL